MNGSAAKPTIDSVAVIARLKPGSQAEAKALIEGGPPYELEEARFERHSVYLADDEVVFVFEGAGVETLLRGLVNDPARSAAFGAWGPLLADRPRIAYEQFSWTTLLPSDPWTLTRQAKGSTEP